MKIANHPHFRFFENPIHSNSSSYLTKLICIHNTRRKPTKKLLTQTQIYTYPFFSLNPIINIILFLGYCNYYIFSKSIRVLRELLNYIRSPLNL